MQWQFLVALLVAIPIILFPAVLLWYLKSSGSSEVIRDKKQRRKGQADREELKRDLQHPTHGIEKK
jgi:hypothetical protein